MTKRKNQNQHNLMVTNVANYLDSNGYRDIKADLHGFSWPERITWKSTGNGHIPDVSAWNNLQNIFEVETDDSIFDEHTEDQWKLFAAYAQEHKAKFSATREIANIDQLSRLLALISQLPNVVEVHRRRGS